MSPSEHFTFRIDEPLRAAARARLHNDGRFYTDDLGRNRRVTLTYVLSQALRVYAETGEIPGHDDSSASAPDDDDAPTGKAA